jgi:hypothetical protein
MVKGRLVKRTRDRKDRRVVFVSMTDKGRKAVDQASPAGWQFINKLLSPLGCDDQRALARLLETVKSELASSMNPEMDVAEITKRSLTKDPNLYKRFVKNVLPSGC